MGFSINTVTISGNLTRDPELRSTQGGTSVCQLRIAHNDRRKDQSGEWVDVPYYFDVTIWSGQGEWVARNLSKGAGITVQGKLKWREYEDKDGNKRQAVDITADNIFVPKGEGGGGGGYSNRSDIPVSTDDFAPAGGYQGTSSSATAMDDDIPF
jgi:single-strand DNA-binding protein